MRGNLPFGIIPVVSSTSFHLPPYISDGSVALLKVPFSSGYCVKELGITLCSDISAYNLLGTFIG